jgi:hypothetical protein
MWKYIRRWWKDIKSDARFFGYFGAIRREIRHWIGIKQIYDLHYWLMYRTYRKFHIVKMDLKPGYHDIDQRLVHANFCLLAEFVEKEKPFDVIDWDSDDGHKNAAKEIKELYDWWKNVYPKYDENDPLFKSDVHAPERESKVYKVDEDGDPILYTWEKKVKDEAAEAAFSKVCMESHEYEMKCNKEIEDNLIRLAKIRNYLWT